MSKATVTKYWCDICKKETASKDIKYITIPIYRTFDSTDGQTRYDRKHFSTTTIDICYECLDKIVKVQDIGVQCENLIIN